MDNDERDYEKFSARMALNMAAPHTWPASILPALVGIAIAANDAPISILMCIAILVIVILMQSSVNTLNDYFDFVKGTDSEEDFVEADDSVLVYNNVNPHSALALAVVFLAVAFLIGVYIVLSVGIAPLIIAVIGAVFVVLYSAGKTPISYLPIGEFVSGIVMGGLIPLGAYTALAGTPNLFVLLLAIPTCIGVGLIMLTNNTCDIERDIVAGRQTLPVRIGRQNSRAWYRVFVIVWCLAIIACTAVRFQSGLIIIPFMLLASYPLIKAAFANPLTPNRRTQAMPQTLTLNIVLGAFYAAAIFAQASPAFVL